MGRKAVDLKKLVRSIVNYLNDYFKIEEVILFGSQLTGKAHAHSDIDLAVVSSDFEKKKLEDLLKVFSRLSIEISPGIDIHPFTPRDIKEARPTNFIGHILETGRVVYHN